MTTLTRKYFHRLHQSRPVYIGYMFARKLRSDVWRYLTPEQLEIKAIKLINRKSLIALGMAKFALQLAKEKRTQYDRIA